MGPFSLWREFAATWVNLMGQDSFKFILNLNECCKQKAQPGTPHCSVLRGCDVTEVSVEAEIEADVATGEANDWAPQEMQGGQLVEEVLVDAVGNEGEDVADEGNDEEQLPAVDVWPGADEQAEENRRQGN